MQLLVEQATIVVQDFAATAPAQGLVVYPNPAHDVTTAQITSQVTGTVKIIVFDMNGRQVLADQTVKTSDVVNKTLNVSALTPGMYTVQVTIGNQKTMVTKLMKN